MNLIEPMLTFIGMERNGKGFLEYHFDGTTNLRKSLYFKCYMPIVIFTRMQVANWLLDNSTATIKPFQPNYLLQN